MADKKDDAKPVDEDIAAEAPSSDSPQTKPEPDASGSDDDIIDVEFIDDTSAEAPDEPADETADDAAVVLEEPQHDHAPEVDPDEAVNLNEAEPKPADDAEPTEAPTILVDTAQMPDDLAGDDGSAPESDPPVQPDPAPTPEPTPEPKVIKETVVQRVGVLPLVLGGVIAAIAGFLAARSDILDPILPASLRGGGYEAPIADNAAAIDALRAEVSAQLKSIDDVGQRVDALAIPDLAPVVASLDALRSEMSEGQAALRSDMGEGQAALQSDVVAVSEGISTIRTRVDGLDVRLNELEKRPVQENLSEEAIAAYERELTGVQRALNDQKLEIDRLLEEERAAVAALIDDTSTQMSSAVQAELDRIESIVSEVRRVEEVARQRQAEADRAEKYAAAQTALAAIRTALGSGEGYADTLVALQTAELEIPAALNNAAEDGMITHDELMLAFPDAARAGIDADRRADPDAPRGLGAFIERQLGARSVTPQEGDSADAVLSRVEGALKARDLEAALAEAGALPDAAAAAMTDWIALAQSRQDAIDAVNTVAGQLNSN